MRIEFCGPPGVGKSTIFKALKQRGKITPEQRVAAHPFLEFVRRAYAGREKTRRIGYAQIDRAFQIAMAADQAPGNFWFDEMLVQRGLSFALSHRGDLDAVRAYFDLLPPPALTVFVFAPLTMLEERNRRRTGTHGKRRDRSAQADYLLEMTKLGLDRLMARGAATLALDATLPPEKNALWVRAAVPQ